MLPDDFKNGIPKLRRNSFWQKIFILWPPKTKRIRINTKLLRVTTLPKNQRYIKLSTCVDTVPYRYKKITKFNIYPLFSKVLIFKLWGYKLKISTFISTVRLMTNANVYTTNHFYKQKKLLTKGVNFNKILTLL